MAKANWTTIKSPGFQAQQRKLNPERSATGGIKAVSASKRVRDAVYRAINELFACANPMCQTCDVIWPGKYEPHWRLETHHRMGKDGLLYFDVRWFMSTCRRGHIWIGDHPDEALKLGLNLKRNK